MQLELQMPREMTPVDASLIAKQASMTKALQLCQTLSGKDDAQFYGDGGIVKDQAQWSRIMGPSNHSFPHDKLNLFMDLAGNEAPLLWLLHSRGYELSSLHLRETETERELRITKQRLAAVEAANLVLVNAMNGRAVA
jgi:hypothetical protein